MFRFLLALLLVSTPAAAQEWRVGELHDMSMEFYRLANNRDAYYPYLDMVDDEPGEYWDYGTAVKFDTDLLKYGHYGFHWRNTVRGQSTDVQFRSVEWDFRWGLELGEKVEIFYDHTSAHCLECAPERREYKLHNGYGVEVHFYKRP